MRWYESTIFSPQGTLRARRVRIENGENPKAENPFSTLKGPEFFASSAIFG
jgi:hypothetical protein